MKINQPWLDSLAVNSVAALQLTIGVAPRAIRLMFDILTFCAMFTVAVLLLVFGASADETPDRE